METKLEAVDARLHDAKETEKTQGLGLQDRLEVWDKSLKDMHRGIQLIRDKQELLEAQSELAELKKAEETKRLLEARQLQEAKAAEAAEAASKASQAAAAPPARVKHLLQSSCQNLENACHTVWVHLTPKQQSD